MRVLYHSIAVILSAAKDPEAVILSAAKDPAFEILRPSGSE
jgi:hypothetical protein